MSALPKPYIIYGMKCSYFTGKLEAYFQSKGLPFEFIEMNIKTFRACGKATGIKQLPVVETPEGGWLYDTTSIISHFEDKNQGPKLRPQQSATAFCSLLFEDMFDEWLWRPALYYRWAHKEDATLMSNVIARTLGRDLPLPQFIRRQLILQRQKRVYLRGDGVTKTTAPAIAALYTESLTALESIFEKRPFLFGQRPCEADFGLFGPYFRHFFCDPTSGAIMREQGPHVAHWVTRLWRTRPETLDKTEQLSTIPDDLSFFFKMADQQYLPYLAANAKAFSAQQKILTYSADGVNWKLPTAPYRVSCLNQLKQKFAKLDDDAHKALLKHLPVSSIQLLRAPITPLAEPNPEHGVYDRLWKNTA